MGTARATHVVVSTLGKAENALRVTQVRTEVLAASAASAARVTQVVVSALGNRAPDFEWCEVFEEILFPTDISLRSEGGGAFRTLQSKVRSGWTQRVSEWDEDLGRWNITKLTDAQKIAQVRDFFRIVDGPGIGFRVKDPDEYSTALYSGLLIGTPAGDDMPLGTGDGATDQFQLKLTRTWPGSARTATKTITKPNDDILIEVAAAAVTNFTTDTTTGVVTFTPRVSVTGTDIQVVHDGVDWVLRTSTTSWAGFLVGDHIRVAGSTSNDTALPAGFYTVKTPVPAGAGDLKVAEVLTAEAAGASITVDVHPAPLTGQAITWGGTFHKPAHFLNDHLPVEYIEGEGGTIRSISAELEELRRLDALSGA